MLRDRAVIPASSIRPLDTPAKQLALKRTPGFLKSMKELDRHRDILQQSEGGGEGGAENGGGTTGGESDEPSGEENELNDEQVGSNNFKVIQISFSSYSVCFVDYYIQCCLWFLISGFKKANINKILHTES